MPRHHRTSSEAAPRQQQHHTTSSHPHSHSRSSSYQISSYATPSQHGIPVAPGYYTIPPTPQQDNFYGQPTPVADDDDEDDSLNNASSMPSRPSSGAWTAGDDQQLIAARQHGLNWKQIRNTYFPAKSPNACRKRHERLLEKRDPDEWTQGRLHNLAKEYMNVRKEIWTPLAARTGEKWNVVEQRCMSSGLKNLQSAARAASRLERYRNAAAAERHGSASDSGVSGIGLTPVDELDPNTQYSSPSISPAAANSSYTNNAQQQAAYVHQQQQQQQQLAAMQATHYRGSTYADMTAIYAAYASHPTYTSSASSSASNLAHPYVSRGGRGSSQGSSPYMEEAMDGRSAGRV